MGRRAGRRGNVLDDMPVDEERGCGIARRNGRAETALGDCASAVIDAPASIDGNRTHRPARCAAAASGDGSGCDSGPCGPAWRSADGHVAGTGDAPPQLRRNRCNHATPSAPRATDAGRAGRVSVHACQRPQLVSSVESLELVRRHGARYAPTSTDIRTLLGPALNRRAAKRYHSPSTDRHRGRSGRHAARSRHGAQSAEQHR